MKLTIGQMIGLVGAALVLLCFFFPWIEVDLWLASTNLSGFQLATGRGPAGSSAPFLPSLWLVPLSMLGVLAIVVICFLGNFGGILKGFASLLLLGAGGIGTLVILYQYFNINQQLNQDVLGMVAQKMFSYSFGAHGSLLGSLVVAGGGFLDLIIGKNPTPSA